MALGGQLKEAFALFNQGFEAADQANLQGSGHAVTNLAGWCCDWLGDPRAARAWHELELNRPRNAHSLWDRREKTAFITSTYYEEGQMGEVVRRAGSEDLSVRFWVRGEWEGFADLLETAIAAQERADDRVSHIQTSFVLGTFYLFITGEYAQAEAHLKYGLDNGN